MNALHEHRARLERDMATLLAPELSLTKGAACYVVLASEAGLDGDAINVLGLSGPWFSATYQGALEDRWQGHGPTILLNDAYLQAMSSAMPLEALVGGFGCHEFAHITASQGRLLNYTSTPPDINRRADVAKALLEPTFPEARVAPGPTAGHDLAFVRTTFHLAARLQSLGWHLRRDMMGLPAWLGDPYRFWATLDIEIEERWELPISAIPHLPVPDGLIRIWTELTERRAWDAVPAA